MSPAILSRSHVVPHPLKHGVRLWNSEVWMTWGSEIGVLEQRPHGTTKVLNPLAFGPSSSRRGCRPGGTGVRGAREAGRRSGLSVCGGKALGNIFLKSLDVRDVSLTQFLT